MDFLQEFRLANRARQLENPDRSRDFGLVDWSNALAGEAGEICNVTKKIKRDGDSPAKRQALQDEIADVFTYLDILCSEAYIDLERAVRRKFNEVSDRFGSQIKL